MIKLKTIFRESTTSVLFVIGLIISCFILINVTELLDKINQENKVLQSYRYTVSGFLDCYPAINEYEQQISAEADEKKYSELLEQKKQQLTEQILEKLNTETTGNTYVEVVIQLNDKTDGFPANIIMAHNEDLKLECNAEYNLQTENGIIIGESLLDYVTEYNGEQIIEIGNQTMKVIGVLQNKMAGGFDHSIYIFWENCDKQAKDYLKSLVREDLDFYIKYSFKSDEALTEAYQVFSEELEKWKVQTSISEAKYTGELQNYWYRMYNSIFMGVTLLFSVFNCFGVSYLWLAGRKKELAIRIAYGYDRKKIAFLLFSDIIKLCIPAIIGAGIIQLVYNGFTHEKLFVGQMMLVCIGMLCISILLSIYMLVQVKKISIIQVLSEN